MIDADGVDYASMVREVTDGVTGFQGVDRDALAAGDHLRAHENYYLI